MSKFKTVWFWDSGHILQNGRKHVMSFFDDKYQKPSLISGIKSPDHSACHSFNYVDESGNMVVSLVSDDFVGCESLWYVFLDGALLTPPLRSVIAFADQRYPNGTVLNPEDISDKNISLNKSAGFVRWIAPDSRIQQIFVAPEHRRKRISTQIISVADLLIVSDPDWNGHFLNGGDITTQDGETLRAAWSNSVRVTPRIGSVTRAQSQD